MNITWGAPEYRNERECHIMELLGRRIAECRKEKQFTQDELAVRLGITPQALSKWERSQSLPDIALLKELCGILGVSADYLLGMERDKIIESGDERIQDEIWMCLRNAAEPLELVFGIGVTQAFLEKNYTQMIVTLRKELAAEGMLMPIVRLRDITDLEPNEYRVLSYGKIIFKEAIAEIEDATCGYIIDRLGDAVRKNYAELLEPDLVKKLIDNLQIKYPALIQGIVPEKISYGLLTEVLKNVVPRGGSMAYLPKILERLECLLRQQPDASVKELAEGVVKALSVE